MAAANFKMAGRDNLFLPFPDNRLTSFSINQSIYGWRLVLWHCSRKSDLSLCQTSCEDTAFVKKRPDKPKSFLDHSLARFVQAVNLLLSSSSQPAMRPPSQR